MQVVVCGTQPELSPVSSVPQPLAQLSLTRPGPSWDKGASLQLFSVELGALCIYVFVRMYIATRAFLIPPWTWHLGQLGLARGAWSWQEELMSDARLLVPSPDEQARVWARSDL